MLWFLDTFVTFPVSHEDGSDGISVMESLARRGDSPPYHVHHSEDELFHVLEGELLLRVDGETRRIGAGETLLAPKRAPHSYLVVSEEARWLVVTTAGDFERFVRAASRPAEAAGLPPRSGHPTPEQVQTLGELSLQHRIELLGPPLEAAGALAAAAA